MQPLLEFREIGKCFGKKNALLGVSFSIHPGEIVGFLGPNGAGKTTALSIAVGLLHSTSGTGSLLGRPLGDASARRRLGYLPDNPAFFRQSNQSAVRFAGTLQGISNRVLQDRVMKTLASVSVQDAADVRRLSRGQQQRVALAQALLGDPDLLVLDEPTSALDPSAVHEVRELLLAARAAGNGIFFSSHQLSEVERICDRILFLRAGQIVRQGTMQEMALRTDTLVLTVRGVPIESEYWAKWQLAAEPYPRNGDGVTAEIPAEEQRQWMERIWAAGGELVAMAPKRQSLEDLFLADEQDGSSDGAVRARQNAQERTQ